MSVDGTVSSQSLNSACVKRSSDRNAVSVAIPPRRYSAPSPSGSYASRGRRPMARDTGAASETAHAHPLHAAGPDHLDRAVPPLLRDLARPRPGGDDDREPAEGARDVGGDSPDAVAAPRAARGA